MAALRATERVVSAACGRSMPQHGRVGYVKPSIEALREATEKVARFLLDKAGAKVEAA